ncbi:MAG: ribbon-helix-helix protein, CopG family [Planctomycetaceae bacterium]
MTTLTIRIPDDTAARLRQLAKHRGISLNKLMEEFSTMSLAEFDTETRFRLRAVKASPTRGLSLLEKLDAALQKGGARRNRGGEARQKRRGAGRRS